MDLFGNAKLVLLKEQLAREEHVTSPRAEDATWGLQCSFSDFRPCLQAQLQSQIMSEYNKSYKLCTEHILDTLAA